MTIKIESQSYDLGKQVQAWADDINALKDDEEIVEYANSAIDYDFIIGSDGAYKATKIYLTVGGPFIELDTDTRKIVGEWGDDVAVAYVDYPVIDIMSDYLADLYADTFMGLER